jgi:hypothetical protein
MAILNNSNAISSGGYDINNSLRTRSSASAYLSRTPASAGNSQKFTLSLWVKKGIIGASYGGLYSSGTWATNDDLLMFSGDCLRFWANGSISAELVTSAIFRDPSAWYHIVLSIDTTQATASNRIKLYVNGNQQTAFQTANYPTQNYNFAKWNTTAAQNMFVNGNGNYFDGYTTEINFIDGQALTPSSFGSTDATTGVWQPTKYTGTYGTNGFYLKFSDIATTSGSNAGLGKDFSGNTNYWTTNNISVTAGSTYDAMIDSPTLTSATVANYAVMNPLTYTGTLASANLDLTTLTSYGSSNLGTSTIEMSTGSWYWEVTKTSGSATTLWIGVVNSPTANVSSSQFMYGSNGTYYESGSTVASGKATYATNDVIGIALNASTKAIEFFKNGVSQGSYTMSLNGPYFVAVYDGDGASTCVFALNFGQRPFSYTPPTGFVRLNTYNLPTPTILQGNKYMDATLYTGTGASLSVTNAGAFKPDLVWVKGRSGATDHALYDSVRGTTKQIESNTTTAETTEAQGLTAFGTSGFTVGTLAQMNTSAATYVGWQWQAGQGSTTTGTGTGGITSVTQSVNATAGFSIVTYTGSGSNGTVTHGLGVAPKWVIVKARSAAAENWQVYSSSLTSAAYRIRLNATDAQDSQPTMWNSTAPTSTVFSIGTASGVNTSAATYVAYCWAEIAGFSKFGSYTGNGNADGTFVYTGFRPKYLLIKVTSAVEDWMIFDSARGPYNANAIFLRADTADTGGSDVPVDFLSNGFKLRSTALATNSSGNTYIYMAFAENPFKNALAR